MVVQQLRHCRGQSASPIKWTRLAFLNPSMPFADRHARARTHTQEAIRLIAPYPAAMAVEDPSYFQRVPLRRHIRDEEFRFHLYLFQHFPSNPYDNQLVVMSPNRPNGYGAMVIQDWEVRDGLTMESKVVARAQGLHVGAGKYEGNWVNSLCIVFIDDRFKESSLNVLGTDDGDLTNRVELAIVGGTGEFAFAQGVASCKTIRDPPGVMGTVRELHIRARCMAFPEQPVR